ncbi:MAG: O-antigen ligase family protein, partial [Litoreibacter sp.]|nr:O-antigen ligase family protein [Litoreibacter sp.]
MPKVGHLRMPRPAESASIDGIIYIMALIFLVGADLFRILLDAGPVTSGLKLAMLFPMLFWVLSNGRYFLRGFVAVPELSALLLLVTLSVLWSAYPDQTIERLIPLWITTSMGLALGSKLSLRTLLIALGILATITVLSCFVAVATIPSARGVPPWEDAWRGTFSHKNGMGASCMFMMIYSVSAAVVTKGRLRAFFLAIGLGAALLLIASQSRTSQGIAVVSMTAFLSGLALHRWATFWGLLYVGGLIIAICVAFFLFSTEIITPVFELLQREPTLSGRLPLWDATWPYVMERPWLGYGYKAFWEPDAVAVIKISLDPRIGYISHYSHSGLIELMLDTGLVGTVLFATLLVRLFVTVGSGFRDRAARPMLICALVIVVAYVLLNVLESSILSRESLSWMAFTTVATKLGNIARAQRQRPERKPWWRPAGYRAK